MSRKSPLYSATIFPEKTRRKGLDGLIWEVIQTGKYKKWVKINESIKIKPPNNKLRLKGSCKKNGTKLKSFDIIKSVILNKTCYENCLDIQYKDLDKIYIYHSYNNKNFSGRWYSFQKNNYKLDGKKYILTYIIPEYDEWDTGKIKKNVKIKIFFTEKGWNKFIMYFI